jgi:putative toxin-antitoxin system antitoxin component (TIGR02293 family)
LAVTTIQTNTETGEVRPPAARFLSLSVRAGEVFANREKVLAWLETPNPSLQGRSPINAASSQEGFEQADEILTRLEHGVLG